MATSFYIYIYIYIYIICICVGQVQQEAATGEMLQDRQDGVDADQQTGT